MNKLLFKEGKITQFLKYKLKLSVQSLDLAVLKDTYAHKKMVFLLLLTQKPNDVLVYFLMIKLYVSF